MKHKVHSHPSETQSNVPASTTDIRGSCIIDLEKLAPFIAEVSSHSQSCQLGKVSLTGETYRGGLASILSAKCSGWL